MDYDWALFLRPYADELHPSFRTELSKQLWESGEASTGILDFQRQDFQLIIGMHALDIRVVDETVFAEIDFIVPPCYSFDITIYWRAPGCNNLETLHQRDISGVHLNIGWTTNFPLEDVKEYLSLS